MKRYYGHKGLCYISTWSGDVGDKIEVSWLMYRILLLLEFKTSVVDDVEGSNEPIGWFKFILRLCYIS